MKLSQKLLEIQKACNYFKKDTRGFGYTYTSGTAILSTVRAKMDELGVICYPEIIEAKTTCFEAGKKDKGGSEVRQFLTELTMNWVWRCTETDATLKVPWYGQGYKETEQGIGNALTYAERYFLLKFFKIPTDNDDPDFWEKKNTKPAKSKPVKEEDPNAEFKKMQNAVKDAIGSKKTEWTNLLIDEGLIIDIKQLNSSREAVENVYNQLKSLMKKVQ